ncbi:hypothetical protein [Ramlibacter sp. Leaf400]|uniref:hypothetical protein n=1 Tax=Ramlibacter sp. Leaf400 TaxID=1736365 RepID=UPI0012E37709|nr:hypothetical protein [Ramlibacter sp. Leaf400]
MIGQQNFDSGSVSGDPLISLDFPAGSPAVSSDGKLFVPSQGGVRVFRQYMDGDGPAAAFTFTVDNSVPAGVSIHEQKLVVVEDNLVAIFDAVPDEPPGAPAATAGGGAPCTASALNGPRAAYLTPAGQLVVADTGNHRVLIWDPIPAGGGALGNARVVLGQQRKDTCVANDRDGNRASDAPSAETLNGPTSVWTNGEKLIVVDRRNHRVLIWDNLPTEDAQAANHVIGQSDFDKALTNAGGPAPTASTLFDPISVDVSETGEMAVVDRQNNRVLIWNSIPTSSTQPADRVVGHADFVTGTPGPPSATSMNNPSGVRFDGQNMIVVDGSNNRVLVFRALD